jgi:hypothetical protein
MKKILLLAVLALALPTAMFAGSSVDYTNSGGTLSGSSSGLSLSGSGFTRGFSGPVTWTLVTLANGTHNYTLTGTISGWTGSGVPTQGAIVQLTINTGLGFFKGSATPASGDSSSNAAVPEPGSLSLLGTGLLALAGLARRKINS